MHNPQNVQPTQPQTKPRNRSSCMTRPLRAAAEAHLYSFAAGTACVPNGTGQTVTGSLRDHRWHVKCGPSARARPRLQLPAARLGTSGSLTACPCVTGQTGWPSGRL